MTDRYHSAITEYKVRDLPALGSSSSDDARRQVVDEFRRIQDWGALVNSLLNQLGDAVDLLDSELDPHAFWGAKHSDVDSGTTPEYPNVVEYSGSQFVLNPRMRWRGDSWDGTTHYPMDVVRVGDVAYVAVAETTDAPGASSDWETLADTTDPATPAHNDLSGRTATGCHPGTAISYDYTGTPTYVYATVQAALAYLLPRHTIEAFGGIQYIGAALSKSLPASTVTYLPPGAGNFSVTPGGFNVTVSSSGNLKPTVAGHITVVELYVCITAYVSSTTHAGDILRLGFVNSTSLTTFVGAITNWVFPASGQDNTVTLQLHTYVPMVSGAVWYPAINNITIYGRSIEITAYHFWIKGF